MFRSLVAPVALALLLSACADRRDQAQADSELARDLALVNQIPAAPQFQDTALADAPAPRQPVATTPAPQRRVASAPRTTTPAPRPAAAPPRRPEPVAEPERPVEEERPAPQPRTRGFNAGTSFALTTGARICTNNMPGDKITATVSSAVVGENGAYIPPGTTVVLEVVSVTPGDTPEGASINFRVRSILLNDEPINVEGDVAVVSDLERVERPRDKNADKKKVIGGAVAGAILGQIMGKDTKSTVIGAAAGAAAGTAAAAASRKYDACLPAGGSVRVTTSQPITVG